MGGCGENGHPGDVVILDTRQMKCYIKADSKSFRFDTPGNQIAIVEPNKVIALVYYSDWRPLIVEWSHKSKDAKHIQKIL